MAKIKVAIELDTLVNMPSAAAYGVHALARLREAGIPVFGTIWPAGVTYGTLSVRTEYDVFTGDQVIYEWSTKRGEADPGYPIENLFSGEAAHNENDQDIE